MPLMLRCMYNRSGYKKMLKRRKECLRGGAQGAVAPGQSAAAGALQQLAVTAAAAAVAAAAAAYAWIRVYGGCFYRFFRYF